MQNAALSAGSKKPMTSKADQAKFVKPVIIKLPLLKKCGVVVTGYATTRKKSIKAHPDYSKLCPQPFHLEIRRDIDA
jgi:hypothetical protein